MPILEERFEQKFTDINIVLIELEIRYTDTDLRLLELKVANGE